MEDTSSKNLYNDVALEISKELNGISFKIGNLSQQVSQLKPIKNAEQEAEKRELKQAQYDQIELLKKQLENSEKSLLHTKTVNIILIIINAVLAACAVLATLVDIGCIPLK